MHYKRKSISIRPISSEIMLKNLAVSFLKLMGPTHGISVAHASGIFNSGFLIISGFLVMEIGFFENFHYFRANSSVDLNCWDIFLVERHV